MVFREFGGTNIDVTKGIITFFDLLMKRNSAKIKERAGHKVK